jgi:hypothetical protein
MQPPKARELKMHPEISLGVVLLHGYKDFSLNRQLSYVDVSCRTQTNHLYWLLSLVFLKIYK